MWLSTILDALAPHRCAGCGAVSGGRICEGCVELILRLPAPGPAARPYGTARGALPFEGPVRHMIHRIKYEGERGAARVLGTLVVERLATGGPTRCALVVPIPLDRRRHRRRGYNQAALLARVLADQVGAPMREALARVRPTQPQVGRDAHARHRNVEGAFRWRGPPLEGDTVWLVDDVLTTGATMDAAAAALQQAGAGRIEAVAAAIAL